MDYIFNTLIAFIVLCFIFGLLEYFFRANKSQPSLLKRPDKYTDLLYFFIASPINKAVENFGILIVLAAIYGNDPEAIKNAIYHSNFLIGHLPATLQIIAMLIIGDFTSYWLHRGFHSKKLWKFHIIHHSPPHLDWLAAARGHPINNIVQGWINILILLLLGCNPQHLEAYLPFLLLHGVLVHSNVRWTYGYIGKWLVSPQFHRWHHTSQKEGLDKNFGGILTIWDRAFGTFYMPQNCFPNKFGVTQTIPNSFIKQILYPFRRNS